MRSQASSFAILSGLIAGCASSGQPTLPVVPPEHRCDNGLVAEVAYPIVPRAVFAASKGGWVIASYELDGSGTATNIRIEKAEPPGVFDASVVRAIQQTRFKAGVVRTACQQAFQFNIKS